MSYDVRMSREGKKKSLIPTFTCSSESYPRPSIEHGGGERGRRRRRVKDRQSGARGGDDSRNSIPAKDVIAAVCGNQLGGLRQPPCILSSEAYRG